MENLYDPTQPLFQFNVTCHTEGCENADIVIEISSFDEVPTVVCGPCAVQITDVVVKPTPKKK